LRKTLIYLNLLLLTGLISCSDYNHFIPYEASTNEFAFLNILIPEAEVQLIDPSNQNTIYFSDSVILEIPAEAFVDSYGQNIEEDIQIVFQVHKKYSDLIADDSSLELSTDALFGFESMFFVAAYDQNGNTLNLGAQKFITIKYPVSLVSNELFLYFPDSAPDQLQVLDRWKKAIKTNFVNGVYPEGWNWVNPDNGEENQLSGYIFKSNTLKWIALGKELEIESGVSLEVDLPDDFTPENTRIFVKSEERSSFQKLRWNNDRHRFCDLQARMPIGTSVDVLVVSKKEEAVYIDIQAYVLHFDTVLESDPVKKKLDQIIEMIKDF